MRLAIVSASLLAPFFPAQSAPDSVGRLIDLGQLVQPVHGVRCRQFASTDPSGRGEDHGHFLRQDGDRCVLAEMDGPGVIVRLWSANAAGRLRVYLDGEDTPRIDGPFQDLFTGKLPPFVPPLATHAGGGWISYFPIPYAKACRVEVSGLRDPNALYYQVQYQTYPAGTALRTFTQELPTAEQKALAEVLSRWRDPGLRSPPPGLEAIEPAREGRVDPGADFEVFMAKGPGEIVRLRLDVQPRSAAALRGLQLLAAWDGKEPSIRAPVGDFFACGFGATPYRGLVLGWDEDGAYCNLPMPFAEGARVWLHNAGAEPVEVRAHVEMPIPVRDPKLDPVPALRLHAEFRSVDCVGDEKYEIADVTGPGRFVGVTQTLQGVGDLWYLEGNEEFFVDGEVLPSILGTGTEDFYNGGWYWDSGPLALPLHGLGVKQEWTTNRTTPWRMLVPDAVPFERSLRVRIEHGSRNEVRDAAYASVAFWYGPPQPVRAIDTAATRVPRRWLARPRGFVGAGDLRWAEPAPPLRAVEEVTATHRGLTRPLFQAFPRSHVEHDGAPVDARVAELVPASEASTWRVRFEAAWADRYRMELRLLAAGGLPDVALDGRAVPLVGDAQPDRLPLRLAGAEVGGLTAGAHELAFTLPAGIGDPVCVDALRLVPSSPFVRTWCIAPPHDARPDGTVEDAMPEEATFLAQDFDALASGWRVVQADADRLDLNHEVSSRSPMLAYLLVWVHAPEARTTRALLGSDDGVRLWHDGVLRWSKAIHRHFTPDEDQFDLPLHVGWNRLLVKVKNDDGGYAVSLRLADPDGGLTFAATR